MFIRRSIIKMGFMACRAFGFIPGSCIGYGDDSGQAGMAGITGRVAAGMVARIVGAVVTVGCNGGESACVMACVAVLCGCEMIC